MITFEYDNFIIYHFYKIMKNIPLLIFDIICLPITIIRLLLIYLFGSRYNIPSLQFLDVMQHATNKFFNQGQHNITVDTVPTDIRLSINQASRISAELLNEHIRTEIEIKNINQQNTTHTAHTTQNPIQNPIQNIQNPIQNPTQNMTGNMTENMTLNTVQNTVSSSNNSSIFGVKNKSYVTLRTDKNLTHNEIDKLQKILPNILTQLSKIPDDNIDNFNSHIDTDNIDISKIDKKLNDEIERELDFLSMDTDKFSDTENNSNPMFDSITDL
jgi:hypothetical protein